MTDWDKSKALRAKRAIGRVRKAGGGNRLQGYHFYPEIIRLQQEGWTHKEIATYFKAAGGPGTDRRIRQIIAQFEGVYEPKTKTELLPTNVQEMLGWSVAAFERFFLRFSRYDYLPDHVRPWLQAFMDHRNLLLNVPPRHAKSEFFSVWIPLWLICRDRNVQILLVSETNDFAVRWAQEIAGQLEFNQGIVETFGRFKPETVGDQPWKPSHGGFSVTGRTRRAKGAQFTVQSRSMTNQVLGMEADFVIVDDPTSQEAAESETERRRQLKHLREQVFTRAEPPEEGMDGGRIVVVGQRVHMLDLFGVLEKQEWEIGPQKGEKLWHTEKYPAVLDWDKQKVLWPRKFPWEEVELIYARIGGHGPFSCMYQQEPMPEGAALVQASWIEECKDRDRVAGQGFATKDEGGFLPIVRVVSVDPSPTKWNGIVVGDLLTDKNSFVFAVTEVYRMKAGVRQLQAMVDEIIARANPDYFIFEESGFLSWFRDDPWFQNVQNRVKLILHRTGVNKNSMEYGVQSLAGDFEFARISLPYGDETAQKMTDMLAGEALVYPEGETTDLLMALWFIKYRYQKLNPIKHLPTRVQGAKNTGGWTWRRQLKDRKNVEEENYRRWQQAKRERQRELENVNG